MATVKGSKQHQMVVVPHRPLYKASVFLLFLASMAAFSYVTWEFGRQQGMATRVAVVNERDAIAEELTSMRRLNSELRKELAELRLGGEIDSRANEEIQDTVEGLQRQIATLSEEIRFYKGVMLPNVEDKGLRIERLDMASTRENTYRYSLLLTQVVEKHDFVQGGVRIAVRGREGDDEKELTLTEMDQAQKDAIRFRFRYFQNIDGELQVPPGFEPEEITVVAQSSGCNAQRLEKRFDWQQLSGG